MSGQLVRKSLVFAAIYVVVSLALEAALMILLHWKVPQDNYRLAPCVLTIPPLLASWLAGYRRPKQLVLLAGVTFVLTMLITLGVTRITGIAMGLAEPLFNRSLAGFLAAVITLRQRRTGAAETNTSRALRMLAIGLLGVALVLSLVVLAVPLMNRAAQARASVNPRQPLPFQPPRCLPCFPGAEGFGTDTPAGRGGKIIEVTSLADDGSGTLRAALNETRWRWFIASCPKSVPIFLPSIFLPGFRVCPARYRETAGPKSHGLATLS